MRTMQILQNNNWVDVINRAKSDAGMIRIYKALIKEAQGTHYPVCGMRIITIHGEHLGIIVGKENPFRRFQTNPQSTNPACGDVPNKILADRKGKDNL